MRLLSIGAGKEQVAIINKAKECGHYVIAIDGNSKAEGLKIADEYSVIDISKEKEVIDFAKINNVEGVLQAPIGRFLTTIGAVNDELGLVGISKEAALNCVDKVRTNKILIENNIRCARQESFKAKNLNELIDRINKFKIPCIIKPRFGSGSVGVCVIQSKSEINKISKEHLLENPSHEILLEEIINGKEFGVDFVVIDNKGYLILVREKKITDFPFRQEVAFIGPAELDEKHYEEIYKVMDKATRSLGINNTLVHADLMINDIGVEVIEISGRPSGLGLSSKLVPLSTGIDYLGIGLKIITKEDIDKLEFDDIDKQTVAIAFFNLPEGKILSLPNIKNNDVLEYVNNLNIGDIITKVRNGRDLINRGYIVIKGRTIFNTLAKYEKIIDDIKISEV